MGLALGRIEGIGAVAPRRPDLSRLADAQIAQKTKFRAQVREEGSLTLTTAEGDKVTLSFRNSTLTRASNSQFYGPNGAIEMTSVKTRERSEVAVSLEGNLSEEELSGISTLIDRLTGKANEGDLSTIAGYDFQYQRSEDYRLRATRVSLLA